MGARVATSIDGRIAQELGVREAQVAAAAALLDEGATVPFIARYRKEATGGLDDAQLRTLEERLRYLRGLEERRTVILNSIREQGKLDDKLEAAIRAADSKGRLEDIYLPFKPKRRTKAEIAKEAGLEPLADLLLGDASKDPAVAAAKFVNAEKNVADANAALEGARAILIERFAEDADLIGSLREEVWSAGRLTAKVRDGKKEVGAKFADYFDFSEDLSKAPAHRILALFRAQKEEVIDIAIESENKVTASPNSTSPYEARIMRRFNIADRGRPADKWLIDTARAAWRSKIEPHLGIDLRLRLWQAAEEEAVRVFAANLRDLLLAAPAGARATMGLDPGYRTGVKVAVANATGKGVATSVGYPHEPERQGNAAAAAMERGAGNPGQARQETQRRADLDRERHRLARNRQARDRVGEASGRAEDVEDRRVGGGRLGLFRLRLCVAGTARARRDAARRGVDRATAAGPARRARQDRSEIHRRRPVSARCERVEALALARRSGGRLRQRGRGRSQHRLCPTAGARLRHRRGAGTEHHPASRRERPVPLAQGPQEGAAARAEGVRAMRRLFAHP